MDHAERDDQIISRNQQERHQDPNLGDAEHFLLLKCTKYHANNAHDMPTLSSLLSETLFERKNFIDIRTLKPERLPAVQAELLHGSLF